MNWKNKLENLLAHRKRKDNIKNYLNAMKENVLPTFHEIAKILYEHHVNSSISNNDELKVNDCGFVMSVELNESKVKITFRYLNPIETEDLPPLKDSVEKYFEIEEITKDLVGEEFAEAFQLVVPMFFSRSTE
jgi:Ni,Fe-hydrogenase III component G